MFFTSSSSLNITRWDLLNDHDTKVFRGVSTSIEVLRHWFLHFLAFDVISVAIEADVQGILCSSNVLFSALPALYQIDHTLGLAGSRCVHLVGFASDSASECVRGFDMLAGLTAPAVAWPVSLFPGALI